MAGLKDLVLAVQERLAGVAGLDFTDKDWGQLRYERPPVKFPCALIDVEQVGFSQLGHGCQMADVAVVVTFANQRLVPTSGKAPARSDGYATLELIERAHLALQMFHLEWFAPLVRTNLKKVYTDNTFEVYAVTYGTQFTVAAPVDGTRERPKGVKVSINPLTDGLDFRDVEGTLDVR